MTTTITLDLGPRSYPIYIGHGIAASEFPAYMKSRYCDQGRKCAIVTNTTIADIYSSYISTLKTELGGCAGFADSADSADVPVHALPDGEKHKTVEVWSTILDTLVSSGLDRKSCVIAFGGGVVGDMAGFAAACFMRGVDYVQLPTTLLAMVDSSVGGKTAVDHPLGKNLVGAFHQPTAVWVDVDFLETLPRRQFVAGYAEAFKYAFLGGRGMFSFIMENRGAILRAEPGALLECIERSIRVKAEVVARDERESGARALLNFGHTFAHALERFYGFEGLLHGEAVLWGIDCAVELAKGIGVLPREYWDEFGVILEGLPLPPVPSPARVGEVYEAMGTDKKAESGKLRFVLPTAPGAAGVFGSLGGEAVCEVLKKKFAY